jgi:hypothetical protein
MVQPRAILPNIVDLNERLNSLIVLVSFSFCFDLESHKRTNFIVGRKGFEPSIPAMSRRCLNQAGPPALISLQNLGHPLLLICYLGFFIVLWLGLNINYAEYFHLLRANTYTAWHLIYPKKSNF